MEKIKKKIPGIKETKETKETKKASSGDFDKLLGKVLTDIDKSSLKSLGESEMEYLPTKFTSLNRLAGIGGINISGIWLLHGPTHSGKSALAKLICRTFLECDDMVFYYNYEKADKDDEWTEELLGGKYPETYKHRKPMDFEEGANEMVGIMKSFYGSRKALKEKLNKIKDSDEREEIKELLNKKICFVIDTVAKMVPRDEREGEIGKKNFGLLASLATQFMRVATSYVGEDDSNLTLIIVQHERQNQKQRTPYDNDYVLGPGGESINKFDPDVIIRVTHTVEKDDSKTEIGKESTMLVRKCKIGISGQKGKFYIGNGKGDWPYGFDFEREGFEEALYRFSQLKSKIITKEGNTYYFQDEKLGIGKEQCIQSLKEDPELFESFRKALNEEIINKKR